MIKIVHGDLFEQQVDTIVCPVNTVGVMGKGLAKAFKQKYRGLDAVYRLMLGSDRLSVDKVCKVRVAPADYRRHAMSILLFATKKDWKNPSEMKWIRSGLRHFAEYYKDKVITSVAFPLIGCGLGGLDEKKVIKLIKKELGHLLIDVIIVLPELKDGEKPSPFVTKDTGNGKKKKKK